MKEPHQPGEAPPQIQHSTAAEMRQLVAIPAPKAGPVLLRATDVKPRNVEWLWEPYIPRGAISILAGDPGTGKTFIALAIATAHSLGVPLPGEGASRNPGTVLFATAEDDPAVTLRPRLDAMSADLDRVHFLVGRKETPTSGVVPVAFNDADFRDAVAEVQPSLLVADPIQGFFPPDSDFHRANETRQILSGLAAMASEMNMAVLLLAHLSKGGQGRALYRVLGSVDFSGAARSVLMAGAKDGNSEVRVVAHAKTNLGPLGPSWTFSVANGFFAWGQQTDVKAADLTAPEVVEPEAERQKLEEAMAWLEDMLTDAPVAAEEIFQAGKRIGLAEITLRRAKKRLGVEARREGGREGRWVWLLPGHPP